MNILRGITGLLALLVMLMASTAWAEAGRVMFVSGEASLVREGETVLNKGTKVEVGDTLVTGADGRVQLVMRDGDRFALHPNSRFTIEVFSQMDGDWRRSYELVDGGFRAQTKSSGPRDESSYKVRTAVAIIGVRGTDYSVSIKSPNEGENQNEGQPGKKVLNGSVKKGSISVKNQKGKVFTVDAGESFVFQNDRLQKISQGLNINQKSTSDDFDSQSLDGDNPVMPIEGEGIDLTPGETPDIHP